MFKNVKPLIIFSTAFLLFNTLWSREAESTGVTLPLEELLQIALENNPQIQAFSGKYEAAKLRIPQVSALPDPKLQFSQYIESVQTRTGPQERAISLNQAFPWFGTIDLKEAVASTEAEAVWYAYQWQILEVMKSVAELHYELAFTCKASQLTKENLSLLEELEPIIEDKVRSGEDLNGLLRFRVEMGKIDDKLSSLLTKRDKLQSKLASLLALPAETRFSERKWTWETPDIPHALIEETDKFMQQVELRNPLILMLKKKVESEEVRKELAKLDFFPEFSIGINYIEVGRETGAIVTNAGRDPWAVSISATLPIYRNKYRARAEEVEASKHAAEQILQNVLLELRSELEISLVQFEDARRRTKLYGEELLGLAQQALENSKSSYQSGRISVLEVIDSERSLLDLQLLHARAICDAWQQVVSMQTILNSPSI